MVGVLRFISVPSILPPNSGFDPADVKGTEAMKEKRETEKKMYRNFTPSKIEDVFTEASPSLRIVDNIMFRNRNGSFLFSSPPPLLPTDPFHLAFSFSLAAVESNSVGNDTNEPHMSSIRYIALKFFPRELSSQKRKNN